MAASSATTTPSSSIVWPTGRLGVGAGSFRLPHYRWAVQQSGRDAPRQRHGDRPTARALALAYRCRVAGAVRRVLQRKLLPLVRLMLTIRSASSPVKTVCPPMTTSSTPKVRSGLVPIGMLCIQRTVRYARHGDADRDQRRSDPREEVQRPRRVLDQEEHREEVGHLGQDLRRRDTSTRRTSSRCA